MKFNAPPHFNSLEEAIRSIFGEEVTLKHRSSIMGGDINRAFRLELSNGICVFMKANSMKNVNFFKTEAMGLAALREPGAIGIPKTLGTGIDSSEGISFLLLEMIESPGRVRDYWEILGTELAALHRTNASHLVNNGSFGFLSDNYIGMSPQKNTACGSWIGFFREYRLKPQFDRAEKFFSREEIRRINALLDRLDQLLVEPEYPSLLHGDMWGGNVMPGNDGKAWLIDPAVYVGHREVDLAMSELFGGFSGAFYDSYESAAPLQPGYGDRRDLYNLYQLLNHLNMFGPSYFSSVLRIVVRYTPSA